jgi:hypothetical protein
MKLAEMTMIGLIAAVAACGGKGAAPRDTAKRETAKQETAKPETATAKPSYPAPRAKKDPATSVPPGRQCIVGMWASIHDRTETTARIELHYPRESWRNYQMHLYMWVYPIAITAESKVAVAAIPDRSKNGMPKKGAVIMREGKDAPWQVVTDDSKCPGDISKIRR